MERGMKQIDFSRMTPLFGVTGSKGQSEILAVSQQAWTNNDELKADKTTIINVSQINNKYDYTDRESARNAVPSHLSGLGQFISYRLLSGEWVTERRDSIGGISKWVDVPPSATIAEKSIFNTGVITDNTNYNLHTINVTGATKLKIRTIVSNNGNGGAFFNSLGTYISGYTFTSGAHGDIREIQIPPNASIVKHGYPKDNYAVSLGIPVFSTPQIYEIGVGVNKWQEVNLDELYNLSKRTLSYYTTKENARNAIESLLRYKFKTISYVLRENEEGSGWLEKPYSIFQSGKTIKADGTFETNATYNVIKITDFSGGSVVKIRCVYGNNSRTVFYSSTGTILGTHNFPAGTINHGDVKEIPIPSGTVEILHNYPTDTYAVSISIPVFTTPSIYFVSADISKYRLVVEQFIGDNLSDWVIDDFWANITQQQSTDNTWVDNVITRNKEAEKAVMACRKYIDPTSWEKSNETTMAFFTHTSDVHSDATRFNSFIKYSEYLGVDAAFSTGDQVTAIYSDDFEYYRSAVAKTAIKVLHVLGNHDNQEATSQTDEMQHTRFFTGIDTKMGMTHEGKCYWYTDLSSKKIRIIGLNQYQQGGSVRHYRYFKQDQITWLINTLKSMPADYGVILLFHQPCRQWSKDINYGKFWQAERYFPFDMMITNITGDPIGDIIDAFIGKTTINKTYTQNGVLTSLSVIGDFSTVNTGVEFIAHINGHWHIDQIGYLDNTLHKQLVLNVVAGQTKLGEWCDLPRKAGSSCEDAFNTYGIDRTNKTVRIARVGSNVNCYLEKRNFMVIPYI